MRKRCKRLVRPVSEPVMVRKLCIPDVEIGHRLALHHLTTGGATYDNCYRVLSDCHGVLVLGLRKQKDDSLEPIVQAGLIAMLNIYDRMKATKRVGATGDELNALRVMVDIAEDWWNLQPAHLLEDAIFQLRSIRQAQINEAKAARLSTPEVNSNANP